MTKTQAPSPKTKPSRSLEKGREAAAGFSLKLVGTARIRQTLYAKGVDADTIEQALEALAGTEAERALALWRRKFGSVATDPNERLRQMQFLARRGFSTDAIRQASKASPE